ncbi:zinc finger protein 11-like [Varanus komodoensis]|uniref:zinc finger protein 11-like n=1 Tax=Varanus komodoensis TaxID=61221 RepID=UPI001CF7E9BE|nr:zinc finger protein 11-like [Varanus komodoensis]
MAKAESAQIQQDFLGPDQENLYREVMQESYNTIFMASPLQLQGSELLAHLERTQEAWVPDIQCSGNDATEGLVNQALKQWPETRNWWNSYRSPISVPTSDSSSSDDESRSEKEEEGNVQIKGHRVIKPRAALLGKCDGNHWKGEPCDHWHSQLQGSMGYTSKNNPQGINAGESQNTCSVCEKSFSRRSSLNRHLKIHSSERPYKCSTCGKCFIEKSALTVHIKKIHMHKSQSKKEHYECPECGESFVTRTSLSEHQRAHTNETTYPCPVCEKSYMEERYLVRHLMGTHSGANVFKCSVCGKGFLKEKALVRHNMTHMEDQSALYSDSGKNCREKSFLIKEQKLQGSEIPCKGTGYKKNFRDNRSVDNQNMHAEGTPDQNLNHKMHFVEGLSHSIYQQSTMEESAHLCHTCGKFFKNERCFANHQKMHIREQQYKQTGEGSIFKEEEQEEGLLTRNQIIQVNMKHNACFDCGKPLRTETEGNPHECPDCGKIFSNSQCFANHQRKHTEEQSKNASQKLCNESMLSANQQEASMKERCCRCPNCGKVYATDYNLRRHQQFHPECSTKEGSNQVSGSACRWSFTEFQKNHAEEQQLYQHKCSYCGKAFRVKSVLYRHQQIHIKGKPYKCSVCGKAFAYRYTLAHHQEVHVQEQVYQHKCTLCRKAFRTLSSLRRHQQLHMGSKPYQCDICGKAFSYRYALTHHREIHIEGQSHKCPFCWKAFRTNYSLTRHKRIHMEIRSYQCSICRKAFGTRYSLSRHQEMHIMEKPGDLPNSGGTPADSSYMAKDPTRNIEGLSNNWSDNTTHSGNQVLHMEGKKPECSECVGTATCTKHHLEENGKGLECKSTVNNNLMLPKGQVSHAREWLENSVYPRNHGGHLEGRNPGCSESVGSSDLAKHQSPYLEGDTTEENSNKWTDTSVYSGHQGVHAGGNPLECSENGGTFIDNVTLAKHQSDHAEENSINGLVDKEPVKDSSCHTSDHGIATDEQSHTCSDCGKSLKRKYSLDRHQKMHSPERPYQCQVCKKSFHHPKDLTRHQISHSDLRPYQCTECGKQFKSKSAVLKHQKAHKGEKPYCCSYCGKRVTTNAILSSHLRMHTGERPYKCSVCDKGYLTKWSLKKHLESHLKTHS